VTEQRLPASGGGRIPRQSGDALRSVAETRGRRNDRLGSSLRCGPRLGCAVVAPPARPGSWIGIITAAGAAGEEIPMGSQGSRPGTRSGASPSIEKHVAVTDRIIAQLEVGCAPWVRPWSRSRVPANAFTHRPYRGANIVALWMAQTVDGYPTADWLSFRQALQLGGNVRKGEHGTPIFFYSVLERDDARAKDGVRRVPLLRSYTVFNVAQCDGLPISRVPETRSELERLEDADAFLGAIGATVRHGGDQAFYSPASDAITLPTFEQFETPEHYYGTSLHEHGHWTGAKHRLAREFGKRFGDDAYAFEELVAELTSAFLCAELEIGGNLRHPEYLSHWVRILRSDAKAILSAGARASEAADYLARLAGRRAIDVDDGAEEAA
jgi:antirestriction protein ArdC